MGPRIGGEGLSPIDPHAETTGTRAPKTGCANRSVILGERPGRLQPSARTTRRPHAGASTSSFAEQDDRLGADGLAAALGTDSLVRFGLYRDLRGTHAED